MAKPFLTTTFQDRMDEVLRRCDGNQSEVARRINLQFGRSITPQTVQYLLSRKTNPGKKLARGSTLTPELAAVAIPPLNAKWLASGLGPKDAKDVAPSHSTHEINVTLRSTRGMSKSALDKEARDFASTWKAMEPAERDDLRLQAQRSALRVRDKKRKTR